MSTLILYCKSNLKNKIEPLVQEINQLINKNEENKELIRKGLQIFKLLGELLDSLLHMIIPFLSQLIVKENNVIDNDIRREIVNLYENLAQKCPSTIQYLSLIVDSLIQVIRMAYQ